jgi:uncharacterized protein (UPF0212 family)
MEKYEASRKAVDRISEETKKALDQQGTDLPTIELSEGKGACPGCSQDVEMIDQDGVKYVELTMVCPSCNTEFIAKNKAKE